MAADLEEYDSERTQYAKYLQRGSDKQSGQRHEVSTTPLFSLKAKHVTEKGNTSSKKVLPQYGLLGFNITETLYIDEAEPVMLNTNAPNSAFICGSQGSGKSYTLSTMLENLLRPNIAPGKPGEAVAGVVFHYDVDSTGSIAEAAHLASMGINVDVLVSRSNEYNLRTAYTKALNNSPNLKVRPLELRSKDLSVDRMHKLMAFSDQDGKVPLYMEVILRILREIATSSQGGAFSYNVFRKMLDEESSRFSRDQSNPMSIRLQLLESFMVLNPRKSKDKTSLFNLQPGTLTIIDLSDQFLDASTVCVLFDICLSLIKENAPAAGMVVALDEAHKYMNDSLAATNFTDRLLTAIREQRHNGTRIIISTQEPTLSEKLLDLCSMTIVHRFTSPAWFDAIKKHLGGASSLIAEKEEQNGMMALILGLDTGESLLFSPGSYVCVHEGAAMKLGSGYLQMKTRLRIGDDGGESKMAKGQAEEGVNGLTNGVAKMGL